MSGLGSPTGWSVSLFQEAGVGETPAFFLRIGRVKHRGTEGTEKTRIVATDRPQIYTDKTKGFRISDSKF
jgi:hypothetical protein